MTAPAKVSPAARGRNSIPDRLRNVWTSAADMSPTSMNVTTKPSESE